MCARTHVFMYLKRQSSSRFRLWNSDSNYKSPWSFSYRKLLSEGSCHQDAHICSLLKFSGLQLSSLLKHMLNLQSNIFTLGGVRSFPVSQADLTQKHEHILLRPSRPRCLEHFPEFRSKVCWCLIRIGVIRGRRTQ